MLRFKISDKALANLFVFIGLAELASLIAQLGFYLSNSWIDMLQHFDVVVSLLFILFLVHRFFTAQSLKIFLVESKFEIVILSTSVVAFFILLITAGLHTQIIPPTYHTTYISVPSSLAVIYFYNFLNSLIAIARLRYLLYIRQSSVKGFVFSFLIVIFLGSLLLMMPKAHFTELRYVDALFTSTSAVCVTGLSSINIDTVLTLEGEIILMGLIQIGGLGIITLTSYIGTFLNRGFSLRDEVMIKEIMDDENMNTIAVMIRRVIVITLIVEFAGALILFISWSNISTGSFVAQVNTFDRLFLALFHSVSAYCNAGFSTFADSLESSVLSHNIPTLITVMLLIIIGGIGFYTISDVFGFSRRHNIHKRQLRLQTKIILIGTAVLVVGGAIIIWLLERKTWAHETPVQQACYAFFCSVTCRTAGFSAVSTGALLQSTALISVGIKIPTAFVLIKSTLGYVRNNDRITVSWSTISSNIVHRAFVVLFFSLAAVFTAVFAIRIFEPEKLLFFDIFFETVSAFGTVGLSRGITALLTDGSKYIIVAVMFLGRTGVFTVANAFAESVKHYNFNYPESNITIG